MKIAVTGCAGFIGSNFALYLLNKYPKDWVIGIDCLTYAASPEALSILRDYSRFGFYKADITDPREMDRVFSAERPDVVINFAAESHVDNSISDSTPFLKTNIFGVKVLLDACLCHGVSRFHQISTDEVYGDLPLDSVARFDEQSAIQPSSPYSVSKAAADLLALSYARTYGLEVSISRSSNNYGRFQHREKLIPKTVHALVNGSPVPIYGDGSNVRDWLYVTDHCSAVDLIIRAGKCGIYNISADNEWSNIDLVKKIMSLLGMPDGELAFVNDRPGHDRRYSIDSSKIRSLGWQSLADFDTNLRDTVEWYRDRT